MYPKRRAAAVAEELNKQELEQDAGDDQDEEDDKSFTEADAEPEEALKKARKDPNALPMRRKNHTCDTAFAVAALPVAECQNAYLPLAGRASH